MKIKSKFSLFFLIFCILLLPNKLYSQACTQFELLKAGTSYTIKNYDPKGRLTSTSKNKVLKVEKKTEGMEAVIKNDITTINNEPLGSGIIKMRCEKGVMHYDLRAMLNPQSMAEFEGMQMQMENTTLELPSNLQPGQQLSEGNLKMKINNKGINIATVELKIYNRNVNEFEQITTEAGIFDTYKISYNTEMITTTSIPLKVLTSTVEWYSVKYGIVRSETFNRNGKPIGYSVLVEFKQ
ncbi:MAG: hypothetical protein H0V01_09565 [Bacteroidetes bacterium]|nr:hypothetical protein [Bacteroidota bacterium]HET6243011.1 hypothetical protein [Bacteroidia bacterium]